MGLFELGVGSGFAFVFGNGFGCLADATGEEWVEERWSLSFILEVDGESMGRSIINGGECIHSPRFRSYRRLLSGVVAEAACRSMLPGLLNWWSIRLIVNVVFSSFFFPILSLR